jgi:hypothetical protein
VKSAELTFRQIDTAKIHLAEDPEAIEFRLDVVFSADRTHGASRDSPKHERIWERKLFCRLTWALMGDPFIFGLKVARKVWTRQHCLIMLWSSQSRIQEAFS